MLYQKKKEYADCLWHPLQVECRGLNLLLIRVYSHFDFVTPFFALLQNSTRPSFLLLFYSS
jgi:hypothetical protein